MSLLGKHGETVSTQNADELGGLLFRNVAPGKRYRVKLSSTGEESEPITVHTQAASQWNRSIYKQSIPGSGYGYLTTRDGTQLAIDVHPPSSRRTQGPVPTLIEYSGYGYANPAGPESGLAAVANELGFAVVDVNMRGTGCSGGAFDYFEPLQNLDAYDVIETIAHQPWVLRHKVGMFGVSYGGISQLFAAQLRPPALEAIAPLSVVDATATTLYSGGILNTGFAVPWGEDAPVRRRAGRPVHGRALGLRTDPERRPDVRRQPGSARRGDERADGSQRKRDVQPVRRRPARPGHVRSQHRRSDVHGMPVGGRADRRALRRSGGALHRHRTQVVHVHQRRAHRLARSVHAQPARRLPGAVRRPPAADRQPRDPACRGADRLSVRARVYRRETRSRCRRTRSRKRRSTKKRWRPSRRCRRFGCCSTTARDPSPTRQHDARQSVSRRSNSRSRRSRSRARSLARGTSGRKARSTKNRRRPNGIDSYTSNASATPLTDYTGGTGPGGLWGVASQWQWNWVQPPAGSAVSVRVGAAQRATRRRSVAAPSTSG